MATLTFGLTSTLVTGSKNLTLSEAHVQRLIDAYRIVFQKRGITGLTNAQVLSRWADEMVDTTRKIVREIETEAAVNAITNIDVT